MDREVTGKEVSWAKREERSIGNPWIGMHGPEEHPAGLEGAGMTLKTCWGPRRGRTKERGRMGSGEGWRRRRKSGD